MIQESGKYFYTPHTIGGGFDAQIQHLVTFISVALTMKRIPIITKAFSSRRHRLDGLNKNVLIDWGRYIDLSKTEIFKVGTEGIIERLPGTLQYIYEQDFDFSLYSKEHVRYIDYTQAYDKENEKYPIVRMLSPEYISGQKKLPKFGERLYSRLWPIPFQNSFIVFSPSELVNNLTDVVLNYFGTTRKDMKLLSDILYELPRIRYADTEFCYEGLNYYACMHVRYGANPKAAQKMISQSAKLSKYVEKVVKIIYERNDKDMPLYIMSNIMDANYFGFLKPKYNIYRYTDFKELRERFSCKEVIDNNLLYAVESNIMRHAVVKVFPLYRNKFVFEYPWLNIMNTFQRIFKGI